MQAAFRQLKEIPAIGLPLPLRLKWLLWVLIGLFVVSFLVRALFLVGYTGTDRAMDGDEPGYHRLAADFADGKGWGTPGAKSPRGPLLYLQLAGVYVFTGPNPVVGMWTMVFSPRLWRRYYF